MAGYERYRTFYQDVSGNVAVGSADATLQAVRNVSHTIFLQKAHVQVTGASAGKTWQLKDSGGQELTGPFAVDTDGAHWDMDFGPAGLALAQGTSLDIDVSASGATGFVVWEAYQKLTAAGVAASSA